MSVICDVVVHVDYAPKETMSLIVQPLPFDTARGQSLNEIERDGAGGSKWFTGHLFAAALNHVSTPDVVDWFKGLPWSASDQASMSVAHEFDDGYIILRSSGKFYEAKPLEDSGWFRS